MKLSFIVPTFNCARTLGECLCSILREMADGDELIIVDNGSTDGTLAIVAKYAPPALVLEHPGFRVGHLRNAGAEKAGGEILAFIDSDCVLSPSWRERVVLHFERDKVDALGSRYALPENPRWIEKAWFSKGKRGDFRTNYINAGNFAIRREVFLSVGGFDPHLASGEDTELCLRLAQEGRSIMHFEDVRAVHLGNPKTVKAFFRQQYWHSLGMLGTFRLQPFDKPLVATVLFVVTALLSICLLARDDVAISLALLLLVPAITVLYRCASCADLSYFPQLVFLYLVYFSARSFGLARILMKL